MTNAPAPPTPYDARGEAKRLLRTVRAGALATVSQEGGPFASLVSVATAPDGSPLLLLSRLAAHTLHLEVDPRCSLLLASGGKGDPLAHPRLTLVGRATRLADAAREAARDRFLARNRKAELYADFPDFGFWMLHLDSAHLNGGFARAANFEGGAILTPIAGFEAVLSAERDAIKHMNADHRDAIQLYAAVLARAGRGEWRASGLDPEGIDLVCGDRTARVVFDKPVTTPGDLREALVALAARARALRQSGE